jgi:predicted nucleic acid-binding protein
VLYLDTSALVKLVLFEVQSGALADWLDARAEMRWITSALTDVEFPRAIIRAGQPAGLASVPAMLARLDRFEIDDVVRSTAAAFQDPGLRTLDAIHLATATVVASVASLEAFVTYDSRLAKAAGALGMTTAAPGVR